MIFSKRLCIGGKGGQDDPTEDIYNAPSKKRGLVKNSEVLLAGAIFW